MITDSIADMLTRIRNASMVRKAEVFIPFSKNKMAIAEILSKEGYVGKVAKVENGYGEIKIQLKYDKDKRSVMKHLQRVSKPGRRIYATKDELPRVLNGFGLAIISTSQGVMTNKEARKKRVGGEVICEVY